MKQIHINRIIQCVEKLCMDSNYYLNCDIYNAIEASIKDETSENGRMVLDILLKMRILQKRKDCYLPGYRYGCCVFTSGTGRTYHWRKLK